MHRATRVFCILVVAAVLLVSGCGVLKGNSCGCPTIPANGRLKH